MCALFTEGADDGEATSSLLRTAPQRSFLSQDLQDVFRPWVWVVYL